MNEPTKVIAGTTVEWDRSVSSDYVGTGWALRYELRGPGGAIDIESSTVSGTAYAISVSKDTSAGWLPGHYHWNLFAYTSSSKVFIQAGRMEVLPDLTSSAKYDGRSHVERVLDSIEAVLEKRATRDQLKYQINGRSLERMPIEDLLVWRSKYRQELNNEKDAERVAAGLSSSKSIRVRFGI